MGMFEYGSSVLLGDLNGDGFLNILDVVLLVNIILGNIDVVDAGDVNEDGQFDVLDVIQLINIILGN